MTRVSTHIVDVLPASPYERAGGGSVTVFTLLFQLAKDYLSLEVFLQGRALEAVAANDAITYKAGRKPRFGFRLDAVLLFQLRAELYPRFARFDARQR